MAEQVKLTPKIEEAMRYWSGNIKEMLAHEYGVDKVGHILIVFPFGSNVSPCWISDARRESIVKMLHELADHIESPDARIIRPH
jgi:hypothetical protein